MKTILKAIKLAPRFLFQIYFQPSKVYDFIKAGKKNGYIFLWSSFFQGLILGIFLAIPHYLWYNNIASSLLFAFAFVFAVAIASANSDAFADAFVDVFAGAFAFAVVVVVVVVVAVADVVAGALAFAVVFAGAYTGAGAGAFTGAFIEKSGKTSKIYLFFAFTFNILFFVFIYAAAYIKEDIQIKALESIIPIVYLTGYIFASTLKFTKRRNDVKKKLNTSIVKRNDIVNPYFRKVQKFSLLWGPILAIITCFPIFYKGKPDSFSSLIIIAIGFLILPLFILHIPDYLACLPVWLYQQKKVLKQPVNPDRLIHHYETSLLFKHEMLYFPLPGLHKIIAAISNNRQLGMKEAVKHITHLYIFTFQQKQTLTALNTLLKAKENPHILIHYLLEAKNIPILETLSKSNRLAELYLGLFEEKYQFQPDLPKNLEERVNRVRMDMISEEGYHLNEEMVHTLDAAGKLIAAGSIKDFYSAVGVFEKKTRFPDELDYFKILKNTATQLIKTKNAFKKIEDIERFETKRAEMEKQKKQLVNLAESTATALYEPFKTIWQKALTHCAELIQKEIDLMHGTAVFDIQLINREILTTLPPAAKGRFLKKLPPGPPQKLLIKQNLHFDVTNKGQELGRDVSITLHAEGAPLTATDTEPHTLPFLESNQTKKITFPISILHPGKTTIKLTLTYSDRTRENKQETFSFPVTITKKQTQFKKIKNPYIAGPALRSDSPLFIGRDDIYQFIDENIIPSTQHHTIVCHGLRRTGKSSLLYKIETQGFTDKRLIPINIDLQGISDEKDFYLTLSEKILQKLSLPSPKPVDNFSRFKRFIKEIAASGPPSNTGVVLMLDEFEELQMRVEDNRISRTVFSNIRHLMQHEDNIIFLLCGTHKIEELKADYWSIFFNTALYRRIGSLPHTDAVRLIKEPVKDHLNYDDLAVEQILTMTGCQPYLIQLLCRSIVNDLNKNKKRNDALVNDVDDAVEQIIAEDNDNFSKETWKDAGHLERMILSACAEELTLKHLEQVNIEDILDKIAPLISNFSREEAIDTLDKLVTGEILAEKNLNYCFNVNMTRKWIAIRHPLRKVRG